MTIPAIATNGPLHFRAGLKQSLVDRERGRLCAVGRAGLGENVLYVVGHGVGGDEQLARYVAIAPAGGD